MPLVTKPRLIWKGNGRAMLTSMFKLITRLNNNDQRTTNATNPPTNPSCYFTAPGDTTIPDAFTTILDRISDLLLATQ
jgi:hypothetical protein